MYPTVREWCRAVLLTGSFAPQAESVIALAEVLELLVASQNGLLLGPEDLGPVGCFLGGGGELPLADGGSLHGSNLGGNLLGGGGNLHNAAPGAEVGGWRWQWVQLVTFINK